MFVALVLVYNVGLIFETLSVFFGAKKIQNMFD